MPLDSSLSTIFSPYNKETTSLLTEGDWDFVKKISNKFPERRPSILQRFELFEMLDAKKRVGCALEFLKHLPREGFVQRKYDVETIESIYDHSKLMRYMINEVFSNKDLCKKLQIENTPKNKKIALRLALIHDIAEALTTDFTPEDMKIISRQDKQRLEMLSSRIIFDDEPDLMRMIERYECKDTGIDRLNKVIDVIEGLVDCAVMDTGRTHYPEWVETARKSLGTRDYRDMRQAFAEQAIANITEKKDNPEIANHPCRLTRRRLLALSALQIAA